MNAFQQGSEVPERDYKFCHVINTTSADIYWKCSVSNITNYMNQQGNRVTTNLFYPTKEGKTKKITRLNEGQDFAPAT